MKPRSLQQASNGYDVKSKVSHWVSFKLRLSSGQIPQIAHKTWHFNLTIHALALQIHTLPKQFSLLTEATAGSNSILDNSQPNIKTGES